MDVPSPSICSSGFMWLTQQLCPCIPLPYYRVTPFSWDLPLPKWTQIKPAISVFLTHFCSHIALINTFPSAPFLCWRHALRRRSTQGSWRAVKCTRYSKQTRGKDYLCKVFWLPWFQVVLIIIVAIIYFYLLIYLPYLLISPCAHPPLQPHPSSSLVL